MTEKQKSWIDRPLPWMFPSRLGTYRWCKGQFYMKYVLKIKQEVNQVMATGVNAHLLFYHFYDYTDTNRIWEVKDDIGDMAELFKNNMLFILPEAALEEVNASKPIKNILRNFLTWDIRRTVRLLPMCANSKMFMHYWKPMVAEVMYEDEKAKLGAKNDVTFKLPKDKWQVEFKSSSKLGYKEVFPRYWIVDFKTGQGAKNHKMSTTNRYQLNMTAYTTSKNLGIPVKEMLVSNLYLGGSSPKLMKEMANNRQCMKRMHKNCQEVRTKYELGLQIDFPVNIWVDKCFWNDPQKQCGYYKECQRVYEYDWTEARRKGYLG